MKAKSLVEYRTSRNFNDKLNSRNSDLSLQLPLHLVRPILLCRPVAHLVKTRQLARQQPRQRGGVPIRFPSLQHSLPLSRSNLDLKSNKPNLKPNLPIPSSILRSPGLRVVCSIRARPRLSGHRTICLIDRLRIIGTSTHLFLLVVGKME